MKNPHPLIQRIKRRMGPLLLGVFWWSERMRLLLYKPIEDMIIVSAADSSHFKSLKQLLQSIFLHEKEPSKVIVYDLGLRDAERQEICDRFPSVEVRVFDYSRYPEYLDIKVNCGEYAWKPVIVADVVGEFLRPVCWMDAGCLLTKPLLLLRKALSSCGFCSYEASGRVFDWTHPGTFDFLGCEDVLWAKRNLAATIVAVNPRFSDAVRLIRRWKQCALIKECIAPEGSNRENHRQDQAVLTLLVYQSGVKRCLLDSEIIGIHTHRDID